MNQQQIQQTITSSVPEFSGDNTNSRTNDLIRFIATADSIYELLTTTEEKTSFNRLIKLRLTGEAFTRVTHRNIENYPSLRDLLNNMYSRTYSLEELERNFVNMQQSYGETIRNYGYRLLEALEQYKNGYKAKYNATNIDAAYNQHLNTTAIQTFKRGLNNVILREKVATSRASTIDDIIEDTELTERMLITTTTTQTNTQISTPTQPTQPQQSQQKIQEVICNYCQKPNHTWDVCQSRILTEQRTRRNSPYQFTQNQFTRRQEYTHPQPRVKQPQPNFNHNRSITHTHRTISKPCNTSLNHTCTNQNTVLTAKPPLVIHSKNVEVNSSVINDTTLTQTIQNLTQVNTNQAI